MRIAPSLRTLRDALQVWCGASNKHSEPCKAEIWGECFRLSGRTEFDSYLILVQAKSLGTTPLMDQTPSFAARVHDGVHSNQNARVFSMYQTFACRHSA